MFAQMVTGKRILTAIKKNLKKMREGQSLDLAGEFLSHCFKAAEALEIHRDTTADRHFCM